MQMWHQSPAWPRRAALRLAILLLQEGTGHSHL